MNSYPSLKPCPVKSEPAAHCDSGTRGCKPCLSGLEATDLSSEINKPKPLPSFVSGQATSRRPWSPKDCLTGTSGSLPPRRSRLGLRERAQPLGVPELLLLRLHLRRRREMEEHGPSVKSGRLGFSKRDSLLVDSADVSLLLLAWGDRVSRDRKTTEIATCDKIEEASSTGHR